MAGSHIIVGTNKEVPEGRRNSSLEYDLEVGIFKREKIQRIL
jgi:hypothetical protein